MQIKTNIVSCHTADSKPVKQEVNGTVILPPLVFLGMSFNNTIMQTPLNEEQCSVRPIYSMIMHLKKSHLIYAITRVKLLQGNGGVEGERELERKEKEQQTVCCCERVLASIIN